MASSSDWIEALQQQAEPAAGAAISGAGESWIETLQNAAQFVEGLPVMPHNRAQAEARIVSPSPPASTPAAPEIDPLAEAFSNGEASGREAARAQFATEQEQQRRLRLNFRALDSAAMDSLANELSDTVVALCSAAIADFRPDPDVLLERCKAAAKRISSAAEGNALHLHPDDAAQLDEQMPDHWRIVADETVDRGGLRFEGPDGAISDGPAEWRKAIAAAIRG